VHSEKWDSVKDLVYSRKSGRDLKLDIYRPKNLVGLLPMIVWIHGGTWTEGTKDRIPRQMLSHGYVIAGITYRFSHEAVFPAQIEDCKVAIRWLRAHATKYHINPDRIGVWGASAGGHLAALLGTSGDIKELEGPGGNLDYSSRVQAVCDFYGPTDFLQMDEHAPPGASLIHDAPDSPESLLIGGAIQDNPAKVALANPITYASKDSPPFLILHGDQDLFVPVHQSRLLYEALKRLGTDVTFHIVEGAGHGWNKLTEVDNIVLKFFDEHLKIDDPIMF
jgi:acetyl esterase/lipase